MTEARGTAPGSDSTAESGQQGGVATELARGLSLGRYVVLERLGAGGMGVVYAAYDPELDRKVAIKLLRADRELGAAGDRSTRLLQEAKTLARLSHPNVVTVHDVGTFLGQVFIAMEFIGGDTLTAWLATRPPWPEVLRCFLQAGEGLAAAHAQQLVHRDFKPDNVLLDARGEPRVTDFGLAKQGHVQAVPAGEAKTGRVAGTIGFLAPEQARRQRVDARSDQFSFCLSLYLGLYGEAAFAKDVELLAPLPPVRPPPKDSTVPGWVRRVVLKGLSEDPASRFGSMRELLTALEADPARARREFLTRGLALALIAAVTVLVVTVLQRETPEQRTERECLVRLEGQLSAMWSPKRRAEIEQSFGQVNRTAGPDTWARVRELLNPELEDWHETSRATCVLRGDPALRARREACLEEHRKTLQGMSDVFASADAYVMSYAVNTVLLEVTPASACKSSAPAEAARVDGSSSSDEGLRARLARARVRSAAGQKLEAIGEGRSVANEARQQKARHVEAEAMLLVGEVTRETNRLDAEQNLREAIVAAERVGNDELRLRAWIELVFLDTRQARLDDAQLADRQARAILKRLGNPPLLLASELMAAGFLAEALETGTGRKDFEEALKIRQSLLKTGHPALDNARTSLGNCVPATEGLPLLTAVLETRKNVFGPNHPDTANAHRNVGIALWNLKELQPALTHFEAALEIRLKYAAADRQSLGKEYGSIGTTLESLGRFEDAEAAHRKALTLLKETGPRSAEQYELARLIDVMRALKRPAPELASLEKQLQRLEP